MLRSFLLVLLVATIAARAAVREVSPPSIRPYAGDSNVFTGGVTITLDINSPNTIVHYTMDGTTPVNASKLYTRPIRLTKIGITVIKCYAVSITPDRTDSVVVSATYNVVPSAIAVPLHSPPSGTYRMEVRVKLLGDVDTSIIRYTLNGGIPDSNSPQYRDPVLITTVGENILQYFAQSTLGGVSPVALKVYTIHPALAYEITSECKGCNGPTAGQRFTVWVHGVTLGAHATVFLTTSSQGCDHVGPFLDDTTRIVLSGPSFVVRTNQGPCFVYVCYSDTSSGPYRMVPSVSNPRATDPEPFLVQPKKGTGGGNQTAPPVAADPLTLPPLNLVPDSTLPVKEVQSMWSSWALMLAVVMTPVLLIGVYCWRADQRRRPQKLSAAQDIEMA